MWDLNDVTEIRYKGGYCYPIVFDDGTSGDVDFSQYLDEGPVLSSLRDLTFFQQAHIEGERYRGPMERTSPRNLFMKKSSRHAKRRSPPETAPRMEPKVEPDRDLRESGVTSNREFHSTESGAYSFALIRVANRQQLKRISR